MKKTILYAVLSCACVAFLGCVLRGDPMLFASRPASMSDYDFTRGDLDGIAPDRIESRKVVSGSYGKSIHLITVEAAPQKLDPRIPSQAKPAVLYSHGTGGNMLDYWHRLAYFEDMGFFVAMYDYRGYGASEGHTTEENIYEDAETVYREMTKRSDVGDILVFGFSMGGAPTAYLCSQPDKFPRVIGCFTESTFETAMRFMNEHRKKLSSWYLESEMDNGSRFEKITLPVLMMHGTADEIVSVGNGDDLWDIVEDNNDINRYFRIEGANHGNIPVPSMRDPSRYSHPDELPSDHEKAYEETYKKRINDFVAQIYAQRTDVMTRL